MMSIKENTLALLQREKPSISDLSEFQLVIHRLMSNQVLYADFNQVERDIYFIYRQIEDVVGDYLDLIGFSVYHDQSQGYVILFAPGSKSPVLVDTDDAVISGIRRKLSVDDIYYLLVLRHAYENALKSGAGFDDNGAANVSVQMLNSMYGTLLGKKAPYGVERKDVFSSAKSLRLVNSSIDDWENPDGWIKINPVITSMVYSQLIENIEDRLPAEMPNDVDQVDYESEDSRLIQEDK